jgi:hypothetical protein
MWVSPMAPLTLTLGLSIVREGSGCCSSLISSTLVHCCLSNDWSCFSVWIGGGVSEWILGRWVMGWKEKGYVWVLETKTGLGDAVGNVCMKELEVLEREDRERKRMVREQSEKRKRSTLTLTFGISFTRVPHLYNPREQYSTPQKDAHGKQGRKYPSKKNGSQYRSHDNWKNYQHLLPPTLASLPSGRRARCRSQQ